MSQEKIDRYKEEKANRKKNLAKQKRNSIIARVATVVVIVVMAGWVVWSGIRTNEAQKELESQQQAFSKWLEEMATATTAPNASTGVNLEISSKDATTGTDETGTDEETTAEETTTTAE